MSLTRQLTIILAVCIFLTAMAAITPAYLLIRREVTQQVDNRLEDAGQHTLTLLAFEQTQLANTVLLASQRPTLRRLLAAQDWPELDTYLGAFRQNTALDYLYVSDEAGQPLGGAGPDPAHDMLFTHTQPVEAAGYVTGVIRLDAHLADRLRQQTGLLHEFLPQGQTTGVFRRDQDGQLYFGDTLPVAGAQGQPVASVEILLPVDGLLASEPQILTILLGLLVLVTFGASLAGGLYVRTQIRPLRQLTLAARRMSEGDLATPIHTTAQTPEVLTLATTLEKSRARLSKTLDDLSRANEWSASLIRSIAEGIITFDAQQRITFFSEGAGRILDVSAADAAGQTLDAVMQLAEGQGEAASQCIPPEGGRRTVKIRTAEQRDVTVAITRASALADDQTAIVLHDLTDEVEHRRLQAYFLANVSHEFRTPLAGMKVSIELLLENFRYLSADETDELLKSLHLSISSLTSLVDNLLESSKIEANHLVLRRRPVVFNEVLSEAIRLTQPFLNRRQQTLVLEEPLVLPALNLDSPRMIQVLVNLLSNASKYSPMASCITVRVTQPADAVRVAVEDQGEGIPEHRRQDLFRRFVRLSEGSSAEYGSGLGLAVVKAIVEAHGGQVGVDGRETDGAVFWFTLPVMKEIA